MKAFWTISLLFVLLPWTVAVDREEYTQKVVNDCCNLGKNSTDETCTEYEPMSYFDAAWNNFCSVHYTKCCEEVRAKHNCEKGKQAAFDAVECSDLPLNENGAFIFSLFQSYCCHACRSGINVAKESNNTEQCTLKFSPRLDETAFSACCKITIQKMRGATTTTTVAPDDAPYRCPQCQHKCIPNLAGIITCECFPGFKLAPDGISCLDIDECALNASICGPGSVCVNKQGSHECVDQAPSPSETRMETVAAPDLMFGQLREECDDGYQFDEGEKICMDIDECLDNLHNCKENEKCTNTDGSFQCQVESCPNGERLDENNECVPGNECERGFQYDDLFDECRDIDECDRNSTLCPKDEFCNNLEGSYECKKLECLKGFKPKTSFFMTTCEDINECREDPHVCDNRLESCVNLPGSYECICNSGYEKQGSTDECVDINECKSNPSPCPQYSYCTNTPGSYKCQCHDGFKESENHFDDLSSCSDIDECQDGSAECPEGAICLNRPGHYECKCPSGQEVLINSNKCVTKSPCKALKVNDTCLCPPNFKLSHENDCVDINECDDPNETKCTPDEICLNLFGGYKCLSTACPPGYIRNENYKPNKNLPYCVVEGYDACLAGNLTVCQGLWKTTVESFTLAFHGIAVQSDLDLREEKPVIFEAAGVSKHQASVHLSVSPEKYQDYFQVDKQQLRLVKPLKGPLEIEATIDVRLPNMRVSLRRSLILVHVSPYNERRFADDLEQAQEWEELLKKEANSFHK